MFLAYKCIKFSSTRLILQIVLYIVDFSNDILNDFYQNDILENVSECDLKRNQFVS